MRTAQRSGCEAIPCGSGFGAEVVGKPPDRQAEDDKHDEEGEARAQSMGPEELYREDEVGERK